MRLNIFFLALLETSFALWLPDDSRPDDVSKLTGLDLALSAFPAARNCTNNNRAIIRYVALGLGTQNYTCNTTSPSARPVPDGAFADLFSAKEFLEDHPQMSATLPAQALLFLNLNETISLPDALNFPFLGKHSFNSKLQPMFDLYTANAGLLAKQVCDIAAPDKAYPGVNGTGAVDWLHLVDASGGNGATRRVTEVFRVYTAGGKSPATCAGVQGIITIIYAALYVFVDFPQ